MKTLSDLRNLCNQHNEISNIIKFEYEVFLNKYREYFFSKHYPKITRIDWFQILCDKFGQYSRRFPPYSISFYFHPIMYENVINVILEDMEIPDYTKEQLEEISPGLYDDILLLAEVISLVGKCIPHQFTKDHWVIIIKEYIEYVAKIPDSVWNIDGTLIKY
jgi:hypothetical protein